MMNRLFSRTPLRVTRPLAILTLALAAPWIGGAQGASGRAWLGVSVQDLTPELREAMDLTMTGGALISDVATDGPADKAGLETRDVVLRFDGQAIEGSQELVDQLREREAGEEVTLVYVRGGEERTAQVTLGEREESVFPAPMAPRPPLAPRRPAETPISGGPQIGVVAHPLDEHLAPYFHARAGEGVLVLRVEPDSPAHKAGVLPGDVMESFNDSQLADVDDLRRAVRRLEPGDDWKASVVREGKSIELSGRMERGWQSPSQRSVRELRRLGPLAGEDDTPVSERRLLRRLDRELEKLRDRIEELERKLDEVRER
jgi:serine protease Do